MEKFPGEKRAEKYQNFCGGAYECGSPAAGRLWKVFRELCEKYGILYDMKDIIYAYKKGYTYEQMSLF